ncbi:MAG: hypothetical protein ACM3ML_26190 [Micromonosporaceae bacterium]
MTSDAAIIVFARPDGGKLSRADSAKVANIAGSLDARHLRHITGIVAAPASPNRLVRTAMVAMPNNVVNGSGTAAADAVKALRADLKPLVAGTGLTEGVTGSAAQNSTASSQATGQIRSFCSPNWACRPQKTTTAAFSPCSPI